MKRFTSILFTLAFVVAGFAQDVSVRTLDNIESENRNFDTYAFMEEADLLAVQSRSIDYAPGSNSAILKSEWAVLNPMENSIIKEAINYELDVEGIEKIAENPDVLIQYHIYEEDYAKNDDYIKMADEYEYAYVKKADLISNLENGTIVMSVVDAENGESIWEGFAYNAYEQNASLDKKQQGLRQAVDALVTDLLIDKEPKTGLGMSK